MSAHSITSGVQGTSASLSKPADVTSMPAWAEKTCSAVGLRSRFQLHRNRTRFVPSFKQVAPAPAIRIALKFCWSGSRNSERQRRRTGTRSAATPSAKSSGASPDVPEHRLDGAQPRPDIGQLRSGGRQRLSYGRLSGCRLFRNQSETIGAGEAQPRLPRSRHVFHSKYKEDGRENKNGRKKEVVRVLDHGPTLGSLGFC